MDLMHRKQKRKTKKARSAGKKLGARMRKCGRKWRAKSLKFRKTHKWTAFIKKSC